MTTAIWDLLNTERAILAALGPLAGDRGEGLVTATATGADTVLPPFTYGVPLIGGKVTYSRMVRVLSTLPINVHPVGPTVTSAGTAVQVRAVCGGVEGNLPAGTPILWQPDGDGLERVGMVGVGGITGGANVTGYGRVARVVAYDTLGLSSEDAAAKFWAAQGEGFPALVVSYTGETVERLATVQSAIIRHTWRIHVVCVNYQDHEERQIENKLLIAAVRDRLQGLADAEGDIFSGVPCEVGGARVLRLVPSSHVFAIDVTTEDAPKRTDVRETDGISWQPWATTRIAITVPAAAPLAEKAVVDVTAEEV